MGRYRPPPAAKSPYITARGAELLRLEEKQLWKHRRTVVEALSAAAAEGDRSENAEYIYRKKELREIDRRIRYLQKRLPQLKIVTRSPTDATRVFFSATVELENESGTRSTYRIVGADEFDLEDHYISIDSPLARALLKRELGDEVSVTSPAGNTDYMIAAIHYDLNP
jgi:transcription elongation factor GreB